MRSSGTEGQHFQVKVRENTGGGYQTVVEVETPTGFECFIMRIRLDGEELSQDVLQLLHDYTENKDLSPEDSLSAYLKMTAISQNVSKIFKNKVSRTRSTGRRDIFFSASRINETPQVENIRAVFTRALSGGSHVTEQEESIIVKQASRNLYNALRSGTARSVRLTRSPGQRVRSKGPESSSSSEEGQVRREFPTLNLDDESDSSSSSSLDQAARGVASSLSDLLGKIKREEKSSSSTEESFSEHALFKAARQTAKALQDLVITASSDSSDLESAKGAVGGEAKPKKAKEPLQAYVQESIRRGTKRQKASQRHPAAQGVFLDGIRKFKEAMEKDSSEDSDKGVGRESAVRKLSVDLLAPFQSLGISSDLTSVVSQAILPGENVDRAIAEVAISNVLTQDDINVFERELERLSHVDDDTDADVSVRSQQDESASSSASLFEDSLGLLQERSDLDAEAPAATPSTSSDLAAAAPDLTPAAPDLTPAESYPIHPRVAGLGRNLLVGRTRLFMQMDRLKTSAQETLESVPQNIGGNPPASSLEMAPGEWGQFLGGILRVTSSPSTTPQIILAGEEIDMQSETTRTLIKDLFLSWGKKSGYILASTGPNGNQSIFKINLGMKFMGLGGGLKLEQAQQIPKGDKSPVLMLTDRHNYLSPGFQGSTFQPISQYWTSTSVSVAPRLEDLVGGITQGTSSRSSHYAIGSRGSESLIASASQRNIADMMVDVSSQSAHSVVSLLLGAVNLLEAGDGQITTQQAEGLVNDSGLSPDDQRREVIVAELQARMMTNIGQPGENIIEPDASTPAFRELIGQLAPNDQHNSATREVIHSFIWPFAVAHMTASSVFLRHLRSEMGK